MINHVVLLQLKPETTEEEITVALEHVRAMQMAIPGIENILAGENQSAGNHRGYTHGFIIQFVSDEYFRAYAPHPAHQPVNEELQRICQGIVDFDL